MKISPPKLIENISKEKKNEIKQLGTLIEHERLFFSLGSGLTVVDNKSLRGQYHLCLIRSISVYWYVELN